MKPRIKFFCRSFNKELYLTSRKLYEASGYPCVRLTDQTADGYFFKMLEDTECDIAINVDEDCFIADIDAVLHLAEKAWEDGWINIGCSDGGEGVPRGGERDVTNPFFNIFNLFLIREKWSPALISKLKKDCLLSFEPYYNFFHWTLDTFPERTLYLSNKFHSDGLSTVLFDSDGNHLCSHSWFARQFHPSLLTHLFEGNDAKGVNHALRIRSLIREIYEERGIEFPAFSMAERFGFRLDTIARWSVKIPSRISNWPKKLKKHFNA